MKYVMGFWVEEDRESEKDRSIQTRETSINPALYVLDRSVNRLPDDGEYIFKIVKEIKGKGESKIRFVVPFREIVIGTRSELFDYKYGNLHEDMERIFRIGENPDFESIYDFERINFDMRVMRNLGYSWVPESHSDEARSQFIQKIHDMILSGELNPFKMYESVRDKIPNSHHKCETPFDKELPFDSKYDILKFSIVPTMKYTSVPFISKDIGGKMKLVCISRPEDLEKYKPYFDPDITVKIETEKFGGLDVVSNIIAGYKFPEKGTSEYENMIRNADLSDVYIGSSWLILRARISVPSSTKPGVFHDMEVNDNFFDDVLKDIMEEYKLRRDTRKINGHTEKIVTCDMDYVVDFEGSSIMKKKPHDFISVKFKNGIVGRFTALELFTKMKGKCENASMRKSGDTLSNLSIVFERS